MAKPKIKRLVFFAGSSATIPELDVAIQTIAILVGPNNSGKSLALRELEEWCFGVNGNRKVIKDVKLRPFDDSNDAISVLQRYVQDPPAGQLAPKKNNEEAMFIRQHGFKVGRYGQRDLWVYPSELADEQILRSQILGILTIRLDGRTRFSMSDAQASGNLAQPPTSPLWGLFVDDAAREEVAEFSREAFRLSFVIDPTMMQHFMARLSEEVPPSKEVEQGLGTPSREFHKRAQPLGSFSDGVQAAVGIVAAVLSSEHSIILIDEPEAFLHPPLTRTLGRYLAKMSVRQDSSLIVSTHSSQFLLGALESHASTQVIRLTYEQGVGTARTLEVSVIRTLVQDPLIRSTNVLNALFHRSAIVTESDNDRAFYDEVNQRLVRKQRGVPDSIILNAQNWQTTARIVSALRSLGIPAVALVDLDSIRATGPCFAELMKACGISEEARHTLNEARSKIIEPLRNAGNELKLNGIEALSSPHKEELVELLAKYAEFGLFLVPVGELESWLKNLGAQGKKTAWLVNMFGKLGDSEENPQYVEPGQDDVWEFLDSIARWIADPNRQGLN